MPKGNVNDPISDVEVAFALNVLGGKLTDREAAEAVGLNPENASYLKSKRVVQEFMSKHRESVGAALAQQEAAALAALNIGRVQILAKWWEFASVDPKLTGYNTTSQSKALDSLWKALGFDVEQSKKGIEQEGAEGGAVPRAKWMDEPQVYRSKWMDDWANKRDERETEAAAHPAALPVPAITAITAAPQPAPAPAAKVPATKTPEPITNLRYSTGPGGRASWVPGAN